MNVKWHMAFSNVTITEYAGITYKDYYASPVTMLEAQLKAKEVAESKFGLRDVINPHVADLPVTLSACFGMEYLEADTDELPYVNCSKPVLREISDIAKLDVSGFLDTDLMKRRLTYRDYYLSQGYEVSLGGLGAPILSTAHEISGGNFMMWLFDEPASCNRLLGLITEAELKVRDFSESLSGGGAGDGAYTGDDFSGMLSPEMYREFAIPQYEKIYAGRSSRFMHSELLRAEHLRIAKDLLDITEFHGAACENLTLEEMYEIMGNGFWTQITPLEMLKLSPKAIIEKIKKYANSGAGYVQLYPGRGTPDENMRAAIEAVNRECTGGRLGSIG